MTLAPVAEARMERRERRAMGSPLRLQVAAPADGAAAVVEPAWQAAVDEFEAVEQALSRFRPASEIHRLRLAGGHADRPSRRLVAALVAADRARRVTGGRFDPRVLTDLERLGSAPIAMAATAGPPAWPGSERPDPARPLLRRVGRSGPIEVPVPVDFGGIGKGLALRWAARRVARVLDGLPFLLDAGGDIVATGHPADHGWRIGVEDPRPALGGDGQGGDGRAGEETPAVVIELPRDGAAVATSSIRRARWTGPDGRAVHHLIDPRTGSPGGDGLLAVTVVGPDPAWAEVWSKSLFLEARSGIAVVARALGLAAWWVTADGEVEMTPAARPLTIWVAGEG